MDLYLSAAARVWRAVAETALGTGRPLAVSAAAESVFRAMNAAVAALIDGHQEARRELVRQEEAARTQFVDDLLRGDADVARLVERAQPFGLDLARGHQVALASAGGTNGLDRIAVAMERFIVDRFGDREVLVATKDGLLVAILPTGGGPLPAAPAQHDGPADLIRAELSRRIPTETWRVAVGRGFPGAYGVARSYEEAREALDIARRLDRGVAPLPLRDLLAYRVLGRDQAALIDLVQGLLAPLQGARGGAGQLLRTLEAYFANGGVATAAAGALHVSVRTVAYRLDRVAQLTGYDPRDDDNGLALHMAVGGARLLGWPGGAAPGRD